MRSKLLVIAVSVGLVSGAYVAAQEPVTLTLKSTTRIAGQLLDLNASGFILRVDGQERAIPKNDVATIDFGDVLVKHSADVDAMQPGQHAVLLHSGQVVIGEFVDVGGTHPLRISFLTSSGARDFSSTDVRRIYLVKPVGEAAGGAAPAPAPVPSGPTRTVVVSSRQQWTETGIVVRRGETLAFDVSGEIIFDRIGSRATAGRNSNGATDRNLPVPAAPTATLIARVQPRGGGIANAVPGRAFAIGDQRTVVMPAAGLLVLGINDSGFNDNSGEFRVVITGGGRQ